MHSLITEALGIVRSWDIVSTITGQSMRNSIDLPKISNVILRTVQRVEIELSGY